MASLLASARTGLLLNFSSSHLWVPSIDRL
jgi:hypothetical protein